MGDGMVSGVCIGGLESTDPTVILVQDKSGKPKINGLQGWGLPGGRINPGENPLVAFVREWQEEVGKWIDLEKGRILKPTLTGLERRTRTALEGETYTQYIYVLKDPGCQLRKAGVANEVSPPVRIPFSLITSGQIPIFRSHLETILMIVEKMAAENKTLAFVANELETALW